MRQTLFFIPHELFGLPLFGFGWAFAIWCIVVLVVVIRSFLRREPLTEMLNAATVLGMVGVLIVFVLPFLEAKGFDGEPLGLPIRGYGAFLLAAVLSGVLLAAYRAQKAGLNPDSIYSLAFWMFAAGIIGARAFFVIEYWHEFRGDTVGQTIANVFKFTEGGLVVYGSLIGALLAFVFFCRKHRLPALVLADVIAPCMVLGLAIGRLGCLMNSCCYGGVCLDGPAIQFPQGSQPFVRQVLTGRLLGMKLERADDDTGRWKVEEVDANGLAADNGIRAGQYVTIRSPRSAWEKAKALPNEPVPVVIVNTSFGQEIRWARGDLPDASLPVHPTQLYSSFNAALLFVMTMVFHPLRRRDGQTLAFLLTLYPFSRFLLERIRTDEPGQFGTALTISQWVSVGVLVVAIGLWAYSQKQPERLPAS